MGPFTASGKLIVDGVLVSSFIAFEQSSALKIGPAAFSYQWIAHSFEFPHRLVCHWLRNSDNCNDESYDDDGINKWESHPLRFGSWVLGLHWFLKDVFILIFLVVLSLFCVFEYCMMIPLINVVIAFMVGVLMWIFLIKVNTQKLISLTRYG